MLAKKAHVITACLILGLGFGQSQTHGQDRAPLIDAVNGLPIEPVRIDSPSDRDWQPPKAVLVEDPLRLGGETRVQVPAENCICGDAKCPGVCRDPGRPRKPLLTRPGDRNRGDCPPYRYRLSDHERAGNPHCIAPWAACSVNEKYSAWFVGGGAAFWRGRCRKPSEGTWGLDYSGLFGRANIWLTYTRGRNQGGEGAYETDGEPKFVTRTHEFFGFGH
jgi:hypothetical protein